MPDTAADGEAPTFDVIETDMAHTLVSKVCEVYAEGAEKFKHEKDIATHCKKILDVDCGGTWHVIIGKKFGCSVAHANKHMLFLDTGKHNVLAFQSWEIDVAAVSS